MGRLCSSNARKTNIIFHLGWKAGGKETVGRIILEGIFEK